MKCIQVRENLEAFADDEIGFTERENIASHLANCKDCSLEFEGLKSLSKAMKQELPMSASASLDAKIFETFENHNAGTEAVVTEKKQEKVGWFGIPKFAFATALLLLTMLSGLAFQLGRMSVNRFENPNPLGVENNQKTIVEDKQNALVEKTSDDESKTQNVVTKIVEVPVIKEKIVKIPVIKEKVVTRTIYVNKEKKNNRKNSANTFTKDNVAIKHSVKDGEVLTQTNLKGFEPVAEIKPRVTKKEE